MEAQELTSSLRLLKGIDMEKLQKGKKAYAAAIMEIPKTDPWVPIVLSDSEYKLEFSFGAVEEVFRVTGKDINAGEIDMQSLRNNGILTAVLLAGLHTHHPEMTEQELKSKLTMKHRLYYATCMAKAWEATEPDQSYLMELAAQIKSASSGIEVEEDKRPLPEIVESPFSGANVSS